MLMLSFVRSFGRWREKQILRKHRVAEELWMRVMQDVPVISSLSEHEQNSLRRLTSLFLHSKVVVGAGGLNVDDYMRVVIAAQACLLVLNLSLEYFDGWTEIIVYPGAFLVNSSPLDDAGVIHQEIHALGGEAWSRGPVILSWEDVRPPHYPHHNHGVNVVLHEFAHKLDLLNGVANGMPPLHQPMARKSWTEDFTKAYEKLLNHINGGRKGRIDPYAVESPAEFFAVVTEFFFERPRILKQELPAVYSQLMQFYQQDPLCRVTCTTT